MENALKEVYENQELVHGEWGNPRRSPYWTDAKGQEHCPPEEMSLPRGWQWTGTWVVDTATRGTGDGGWVYGESLWHVQHKKGQPRVCSRWPTAARRRRWTCRCEHKHEEGEDSLSDAQDRLECIRLDLMNLKQHMAVVAELLPCLEKNPTDKRLQEAVTHSASKAKMLHNKCTNHLAHPPSFVRLVSRAVGGGSGGGGSAGHSSSDSAQLVWPPPEADASTQAAMLEKKWCAVQCECASWKPTVLRVFNETMRLCGHTRQQLHRAHRDEAGGSHGAGTDEGLPGSASPLAESAHSGTAPIPEVDALASQLLDESFVEDGELKVSQEIARERAEGIQRISHEVANACELFEDFALMMSAHRAPLKRVEQNAEAALDNTRRAVQHAEKAQKKQSGCSIM